jgi:transcriptional regulator with XRE-family HTH domain
MENNFGKNLRILRKKRKETLESLAETLKISKSAISDYETGKTFPSLLISESLANFFGVNTGLLQNSNIAEYSDEQIEELIISKKLKTGNIQATSETQTAIKQLEFQNRLLGQQVDGLNIQLQLTKQIVESKEAEIRSLLIQVKLLDEKFRRE